MLSQTLTACGHSLARYGWSSHGGWAEAQSPPGGYEAAPERDEDGQPAVPVLDHLLPRVARGDAEAFGALCDQVSGAVYGLVRRIIADQSRAEQVAAGVLLEVWRSASRFSPAEGSGLEWIMTMARRRAVSRAAVDNARAAGLVPSGNPGVAKDRRWGACRPIVVWRPCRSRSVRPCCWRRPDTPRGRWPSCWGFRPERWPSGSVMACSAWVRPPEQPGRHPGNGNARGRLARAQRPQ